MLALQVPRRLPQTFCPVLLGVLSLLAQGLWGGPVLCCTGPGPCVTPVSHWDLGFSHQLAVLFLWCPDFIIRDQGLSSL